MDAFFVSVELLDKPELRGKAVAVGGDATRGVISSASYEARAFGVRSAMPVAQALRRCPHLIMLPSNFAAYREASAAVMSVLQEFTPLVEPLSIDEAFLDVEGAQRLFGTPLQIAHRIRERVREVTLLPASVGLAGTKFVAKLASQRAKPDGVLEIPPERTLEFLRPLAVEQMWGVGAATAAKLHAHAIRTVEDLAREPLESLKRILGEAAAMKLSALSRGEDPRAVEPEREEKSIGHEVTFVRDVRELRELERHLLDMAHRVGRKLRSQHLYARTISVKLRWASFETVTRSRTLEEPTHTTQRIVQVARSLLHGLEPDGVPVRLLGVRAEGLMLEEEVATGLWSEDDRFRPLDEVIDEAANRFGELGVQPARLIQRRPLPPHSPQ